MSDINDLPADWAIERAIEVGGYRLTTVAKVKDTGHPSFIINVARYIETKEEPLVDPWLLQARELAAGVAEEVSRCDTVEEYRDGVYDTDPEVKAIAAALLAAFEQGKAA